MVSLAIPDRVRRAVAVLLVAAVAAPVAVTAVPQLALADHSFVVTSGSMAPAMSPGDVVVVRRVPPSEISQGDVITYRDGGTAPTTHRVVGVERADGEPTFRTKGDANEDADPAAVPADAVLGEVVVTIPLVGHFVVFMHSRVGLLALVLVPAGLLAASGLSTLLGALDGGTPTDDREGER